MSAELLPASLWETPSPRPFTHFGADLEARGALAAIAAQVAHRNQIILICGDGSAYASPTALNTVLQFYALKLHHVLYVSDSAAACATLRRGVPSLACVWSSSINATKPAADSVLIRKWWDMRFYFYNVRKRTLMRLSAELGYDVLQTDTDVAWFANPYPALQSGALRTHDLIVQADLPLANAGVLYAQRPAGPRGGEAAEGDAAAWVLRELYERIRLFSFHPEAVPRFVPWAQPPFFSNADEQTLLNDVLTSAIANATCYIFSTAIMESKMGGTRKNASFRWEHTPEAARRKELMALVRARDAERLILSPSCCAPAGYRICYGARASSKHEVLRWKLHSWELTRPGRPPNAARRSYYAKAPSWLFQHYTHMDAAAAHKPQPRASTALAFGNRSAGGAVRRSAVAGFNTFSGLPPSYMVHLAGLRMGAWHRRAVLRAHGWWHPAADALAAQQLRWGRRKGYLITPSDITRGTTRAELDTLMGNLVLLAALLGRVAVLPEALCDKLQLAKGETGQWKETRRRFGQRRCAWLPHRACWQLEYKTALEMQRQAALNRTLNSLFHEARNRSTAASPSRGNGSACAAALPLLDFLQMDMRKPLLTAKSEREVGTGGGRGGGHPRMGRGAAVGSRGRGAQGEKKPSLARLREALKSVTTAFSRSPTPQLQAALSSAASALVTATHEHRSAPAEGRSLQATPPHSRARKSLLAERRGEPTRQAQLAAALRSLACENAEVASLGDVAVGEFLRHRALRPSQLLTQGREWSSLFPPAGASPSPSPASSEQVTAFLKSLPGYSSNPSSWLQRDAKCIDETFRHAAASG